MENQKENKKGIYIGVNSDKAIIFNDYNKRQNKSFHKIIIAKSGNGMCFKNKFVNLTTETE